MGSISGKRSAGWKGALGGSVVFLLLVTADQASIRYGLDGSKRILDDLLGGVVAGCIMYLYELHKLRTLTERLQTIELMNHHIRNALQPVILVTYEPDEEKQLKLIDECVKRIDFALREILPRTSTQPFINLAALGAVSASHQSAAAAEINPPST